MNSRNDSVLLAILDDARWAPSVENLQFWRFKINNNLSFDIYVDYNPGILSTGGEYGLFHSLGCLLETINIAALKHKYSINWEYSKLSEYKHKISVVLVENSKCETPALYNTIKTRSVNRKPYSKSIVSNDVVEQLSQALDAPYYGVVHSTCNQKIKFASLVMRTSMIRYNSDDFIYNVAKTIDYDVTDSSDKMPLSTLGLSKIENNFFKWGLNKPKTMRVINRYLGGALFTALRLDVFPILYSGSIFYLYDSDCDASSQAIINQGRMIQRFWLTAEKLGLGIQPCYILPVLRHYATELANENLAKKIDQWAGQKNIFFCGRIGYPAEPTISSRSIRLPLDQLII